MVHEGGGAKPSKKAERTHFASAQGRLIAASLELEKVDWDTFEDPAYEKAVMALKAGQIHAILAVAEAIGRGASIAATPEGAPMGGWRSPYPPAFENVDPLIPPPGWPGTTRGAGLS